jgi:hypothetical protein
MDGRSLYRGKCRIEGGLAGPRHEVHRSPVHGCSSLTFVVVGRIGARMGGRTWCCRCEEDRSERCGYHAPSDNDIAHRAFRIDNNGYTRDTESTTTSLL